MIENEVIIVDSIPQSTYKSLIRECVEYAIISLPFTVDRMSIKDDKRRALNIAKGKIAEHLFKFFCEQNNINIDFDKCATPFWDVDNRDFILNGEEWDIKNNFYYAPTTGFHNNYTDLPALVPNRFNGDQWSKRTANLQYGSGGVAFLFTFLKGANLIGNRRCEEFIEILLSDAQLNYLHRLYEKYNGLPQRKSPFSEDEFWREMGKLGSLDLFKMNDYPALIISGYANKNHWNLFKDTGKFDRLNNWNEYCRPYWYTKTATGSINFMNGSLWTTIMNATIPVSKLPSFLSLFPHLKENIKFARLG